MSKVVLSIPHLGVKHNGLEKNKELYVLSFAVDGNPVANQAATLKDVIGANNETLPDLAPEIANLAALRWVFVSASNLFERVTVTQPASLSGSGILLYPNLDPKGLLACHFVVIESESRTRHLGKVLEDVLGDNAVKSAVNVLANAATAAAGGIPGAAAAAVMRALVSVLPKVLKRKRDRIWFTHDHSGFDFDAYGLPDGSQTTHDFALSNDRVALTLRLRVNPTP